MFILDTQSAPSLFQTGRTGTVLNAGFGSVGILLNLLLFDEFEPALLVLPLVLVSVQATIMCVAPYKTLVGVSASAAILVLSEAIVLLAQLFLIDATMSIRPSPKSSIFDIYSGLLIVYFLLVVVVRMLTAFIDRFE